MPDVVLNFDGADPTWDLAIGVPAWLSVLQLVGIDFRDYTMEGQFKQATDSMMDTIVDAIDNTPNGYLVEATVWLFPDGTPQVPGGQFVVPIGSGREPLDALARYLAVHDAPAPVPINMRDASNFVWFRKVDGKVVGTAMPSSLNPTFWQNSKDEASRRRLLGEPVPNQSGFDQISRASYWARTAQEHAAFLQHTQQEEQVKRLQAKFEAAEQKFNNAYVQYVQTQNELASLQKSASVLDKAIAVIGIFQQAVQIDAMSTPTGKSADVGGNPTVSITEQRAKTDERMQTSRDSLTLLGPDLNQQEDDLRRTDGELNDAFGPAGGGLRTPIVLPAIQLY